MSNLILIPDFILTPDFKLKRNIIVVADNEGKILELTDCAEISQTPDNIVHLNGILIPGFVNCHCHLELSYLHNRIVSGTGLNAFISNITQHRLIDDSDKKKATVEQALISSKKAGIVAIGDTTNTDFELRSLPQASDFQLLRWFEVFGLDSNVANDKIELFAKAKKNDIYYITPHSFYSVSPKLMQYVIKANQGYRLSIHFLESPSEKEFFKHKSGPIAERYLQSGLKENYFFSDFNDIVDYFIKTIPSNIPLLLVHNTFITEEDIAKITEHFSDVWFCLCPKSNLYIENAVPPLRLLLKYTDKIVIGTDSLASNDRLDILDELRTLQQHYPEIQVEDLLKFATANGAVCLGFDDSIGTIEVGKKPGLLLLENLSADFKIKSNTSVKRII